MTREVKESCCQFGEHRQLAGVITEPRGAAPRVAVVLVTEMVPICVAPLLTKNTGVPVAAVPI